MKYIVTGGNGFLGRAVCDVLIQDGHDVTVFDNFSRSNGKNLIDENNIKMIEGDIRDKNLLLKSTKGIDGIIHLAFINGTEYFYTRPNEVVEVGIKGMLNVSEAAKENNVGEIILFSSSEVYQKPKMVPTSENVELVIPDIFNPRYSYGGAKIASELILVNMCDKFLDSWKIIRPHNIYGPNMGTQHVIPALVEKVFANSKDLEIQGDGSQTRAFCHVQDFKSAFSLVLRLGARSEVFNIGVDEEIRIDDLAKLIMDVAGLNKEIRGTEPNVGETQRRCPDIRKISELGFRKQISLKVGIEELVLIRKTEVR